MSHNKVLFLSSLLVLLLSCAFGDPIYSAYDVAKSDTGYTAKLKLTSGAGPYGNDVQLLDFSLTYETPDRIHMKIQDANDKSRWQVPGVVQTVPRDEMRETRDRFNRILGNKKKLVSAPLGPNFAVTITESPFAITITRTIDNKVVFDTTGIPLIFEDQFLSIGTQLPQVSSRGPHIYGLGERVHSFRLDPNNKVYSMFSRDRGTPVDQNLYGVHPFYVDLRENGNAHGVFLLNSNAMDVSLNGDSSSSRSLVFRTIGGIIDMYFFAGPKPEDVVQQYHEVIGTPFLPPSYALGFHQCRWGYKSVNETKKVVDSYKRYSIPLDVMWNDIDYMDETKDFTLDPVNFAPEDMKKFVDQLHSNNQRYIAIVDPGILVKEDYQPYVDGINRDVFIKKRDGKSIATNKVWPGITAFPDFSNPETTNYWYDQLNKFYQLVPLDGLWIDMNEPAGFCHGECESEGKPAKTNGVDYNNPPYTPQGVDNLYTNTLWMDSVTHDTVMYNNHNMYGFMETKATVAALQRITGKRTMVLSRSTYAGTGHYGAHWLGDNDSTWDALYYSIPGILNFNLFGVPLVGPDICGFNGNTNEELCTRWMQLGAFYGFSRNHNSINQISQEPYAFGPKLAEISRNILLIRYSLHPYYYTQFVNAHVSGGTVMKPMWFEYPDDQSCDGVVPLLDRQFLVGNALMVSPVLNQGATSVSVYFPNDPYYDYYTGAMVETRGNFETLDAPMDKINLHVRGGYIIPRQHPALTTAETRKNPFQLLVALNSTGGAKGMLYLDDGEQLDSVSSQKYSLFELGASTDQHGGSVWYKIQVNNYPETSNLILESVKVYGVNDFVCKVFVDGNQIPSYQFTYDSILNVLEVTGQKHNMSDKLLITYSC